MQNRTEFQLREWQKQLDSRLVGFVDSQEPVSLYAPIRYVLESGGKRIRPVMLLLCCEAVGGDVEEAWDAALAVELLHDFTLVHDDIMDEDDTRRGRPTVHKRWSRDIAILAGDGLFSLAYRSLLKTRSPRLHEILNVFNEGVLAVCEGQAFDMEFEARAEVSLSDYLGMIGRKTARLLQVSAQIGALVGNGEPGEVAALSAFANNIGLAFQIQDDLLDILSDETILGKTHASDIQQKKQTYLVVHALANSNEAATARLRQFLFEETGRVDIDEVKRLFHTTGSVRSAREAISQYVASAEACLDAIAQPPRREGLRCLLNRIAERKA